MNASEAREEIEAAAHRQLTAAWRQAARHIAAYLREEHEDLADDIARMTPVGDALTAQASAILAAADRYRDGDVTGNPVHLTGLAGAGSACRYRWMEPELLALTGNPEFVTCARCRKSRRYRDLTGDSPEPSCHRGPRIGGRRA
jgi:hypothetical protein